MPKVNTTQNGSILRMDGEVMSPSAKILPAASNSLPAPNGSLPIKRKAAKSNKLRYSNFARHEPMIHSSNVPRRIIVSRPGTRNPITIMQKGITE